MTRRCTSPMIPDEDGERGFHFVEGRNKAAGTDLATFNRHEPFFYAVGRLWYGTPASAHLLEKW